MNSINFQTFNKTKKAFACAVLVIVLLAVLTSCTPKTPVTADFFEEKAQALGYTPQDITDQSEPPPFKITTMLLIESGTSHFEFLEVGDNNDATYAFYFGKAGIESRKEIVTLESSVIMGVYQKYTLNTPENYYLIERVGTTLVYAACDQADAQKVTELLDAIGY